MRFKVDRASLIVGRKFKVFAFFPFVFEGNFPSTSPQGAYIWRGDLTESFLRYRFGGLIFGGAYIWRSLFSEFYGSHLGLTTDQHRLILSSNKNEKHLCHKKYPQIQPNSRTVLKSGCHDSKPLDFEFKRKAFGLVCP